MIILSLMSIPIRCKVNDEKVTISVRYVTLMTGKAVIAPMLILSNMHTSDLTQV